VKADEAKIKAEENPSFTKPYSSLLDLETVSTISKKSEASLESQPRNHFNHKYNATNPILPKTNVGLERFDAFVQTEWAGIHTYESFLRLFFFGPVDNADIFAGVSACLRMILFGQAVKL
jgi:hypothetical protein